MAQTTTKATKGRGSQTQLPTNELLGMFAGYNPIDHTDEDVNHTADSMLKAGWATVICINKVTQTIVGGHGRTMAADMLRQQPQEWFDQKFKEFAESADWGANAEKYRQRFQPSYWEQCPVIYIDVDDSTERATNVRLNNSAFDGRRNHAKVASLLAQLDKRQQEQAGYEPATAQSFIDAYLERRPKAEITEAVEVAAKQFFEREDATVYDEAGQVVSGDELAQVLESGDIPDDWKAEIDGRQMTEADIQQTLAADAQAEEGMSREEIQVALEDLDLDDIDGFRCTSVDKEIAETRVVLLVSKADLARYKSKIGLIAEWLKVDKGRSAKVWRPETFMRMVDLCHENAANALGRTVETTAESGFEEDADDDLEVEL